jgi:hypothetical protein
VVADDAPFSGGCWGVLETGYTGGGTPAHSAGKLPRASSRGRWEAAVTAGSPLTLLLPLWQVFPYPVTTSATRIVMDDDDHAVVDLSESFPFYDETFAQAFLSSNGFITFSNDIDRDNLQFNDEDYNNVVGGMGTEATLKYHFKSKRIAFFLQDLNPAISFAHVAGRRLSQTADPSLSTEIYHETHNAGTDDVVEVRRSLAR